MTSTFHTNNSHPVEHHSLPSQIFHAVVEKNYDGLANIFAENARNSVFSYLSMNSRWAWQQDSKGKSEEKIDEFMQHASHSKSWQGLSSATFDLEKYSGVSDFYSVLQHLSVFISENTSDSKVARDCQSTPLSTPDVALNHGSKNAHQLIWEACSTLADSSPPSNFCIYDRSGATTPPQGNENDPPIFDGSVANATPAPHGDVGASGGTGTILHLVCAMDRPLMLAFLLIMGADGRANHTAFRRLMIHEAACNGSINCLTLLLEMGRMYAKEMEDNIIAMSCEKITVPFLPDSMERSSPISSGPRLSARPMPQIPINLRHVGRATHMVRRGDHDNTRGTDVDCIQILQQFKSAAKLVKEGNLTELQAARSLLTHAHILDTTRTALISSCSFRNDNLYAAHSFLIPFGCADGHGNTPLHWASFKNERECVALLLRYNADPNARAHPSGWTPLHDAAYSNSSACIDLLSENGAQIDAKANSGATPLCFAAQEDASEAAQLLLDRGADLASRCAGPPAEDDGAPYNFQLTHHLHSRFSGYTPLHYCAHYNAQRASHVLLNHPSAKIAMEVPDLSGRLPIHVAVARGSSDVLRKLLHSGARVDTPPSRSPTKMARHTTANFSILSAVTTRRPPIPEEPRSPNRSTSSSTNTSPVTSPILRSMIPSQPISSSKPWNCLSQQAIDECKELILKSEQSWSPHHHLLFTPQDRKAVMELLRVGKRLEQNGTGIFIDLWPTILGFCGRGWFEKKEIELPYIKTAGTNHKTRDHSETESNENICFTNHERDDYLALPRLDN